MNGDDERNCKMSDLAQDNDLLRTALHDISEIWGASDGVECCTPKEKYLKMLCVNMYHCAMKALKQT